MVNIKKLIGKTISSVYINKEKTVIVFISTDGIQYELLAKDGTYFTGIEGLTNLLGRKILFTQTSKFCVQEGHERRKYFVSLTLDYTDQIECLILISLLKNHYPAVNLVNGAYALFFGAFSIKKLLKMSNKDRVVPLLNDFTFLRSPN